jgi:uncharacterized protein YqgC (DUF456 family)
MTAFTHKTGASWWSIILALVAGLIGTFAFPPIGGLIAAPLVLYLLEWNRLQESCQGYLLPRKARAESFLAHMEES